MTKEDIGIILKSARNSVGLTPSEVVSSLKTFNIDISEKTLYGYENGHSSPQISTLFHLCDIYGIEDISGTFGFKSKNATQTVEESNFTETEKSLICAYRTASEDDRAVVDTVLKKYMDVRQKYISELAM